jgi:hypothetical protein
MKLFQNAKGAWFASFTDQKGKRRFVSLKTKDGKVAKQIAEQIVPHELSRTREPIYKEVATWKTKRNCVARTGRVTADTFCGRGRPKWRLNTSVLACRKSTQRSFRSGFMRKREP